MPRRGFAALAFVLVLLFTMSLALLWTGRGLLFEHRAAANQQRQAVAFAAAESGLEWARARLNDARAIDERCAVVTLGASFRDRYAAPWVAAPDAMTGAPPATRSGYAPPVGMRASCRIDRSRRVCDCASALDHRHADDESPSFTIELASVAGEGRALWLVARGCSGGAAAECAATAVAQAEAQAVLRIKLRLVVPASSRLDEEAEALRLGPLAVVPGSWRDGRCTAALPEPCGFEP